MLVFKAAIILSVVLLIRCEKEGENGRRNKHKNKGDGRSLAKDIRQLKEVIPDLAIDTITESSDIFMSDLKELMETLKENNQKVEKKPEEAAAAKDAEMEVEEAALQISLSDRIEAAQYDLVNVVCKAAKHARGDEDVILGKLLEGSEGSGSDSETKRSASEGKGRERKKGKEEEKEERKEKKRKEKEEEKEKKDCLKENPFRDEIEDVLENIEKQISDHYIIIIGKKLDKIEETLQASDKTKEMMDREEMVDMQAMRDAAALRIKSSMERIGHISCSLINAAESIDESLNEKRQAQALEKALDVITTEDKRGKMKLKRAMRQVKKSADKASKKIEKIVTRIGKAM